jgi:hypothetical protein
MPKDGFIKAWLGRLKALCGRRSDALKNPSFLSRLGKTAARATRLAAIDLPIP